MDKEFASHFRRFNSKPLEIEFEKEDEENGTEGNFSNGTETESTVPTYPMSELLDENGSLPSTFTLPPEYKNKVVRLTPPSDPNHPPIKSSSPRRRIRIDVADLPVSIKLEPPSAANSYRTPEIVIVDRKYKDHKRRFK